jgi:hypothetical protein
LRSKQSQADHQTLGPLWETRNRKHLMLANKIAPPKLFSKIIGPTFITLRERRKKNPKIRQCRSAFQFSSIFFFFFFFFLWCAQRLYKQTKNPHRIQTTRLKIFSSIRQRKKKNRLLSLSGAPCRQKKKKKRRNAGTTERIFTTTFLNWAGTQTSPKSKKNEK